MTTKSLVIRHMDSTMEYVSHMNFILAGYSSDGIYLQLLDEDEVDIRIEKVSGFTMFDEE